MLIQPYSSYTIHHHTPSLVLRCADVDAWPSAVMTTSTTPSGGEVWACTPCMIAKNANSAFDDIETVLGSWVGAAKGKQFGRLSVAA